MTDRLTAVAITAWKRHKLSSSWSKISTPDDVDLRTLRVELLFHILESNGAYKGVLTYSGHRVECNGLETDEIVARGNRSRDGGGPCGVLGNHLACSPASGVDCAGEQTGLVNFKLKKIT